MSKIAHYFTPEEITQASSIFTFVFSEFPRDTLASIAIRVAARFRVITGRKVDPDMFKLLYAECKDIVRPAVPGQPPDDSRRDRYGWDGGMVDERTNVLDDLSMNANTREIESPESIEDKAWKARKEESRKLVREFNRIKKYWIDNPFVPIIVDGPIRSKYQGVYWNSIRRTWVVKFNIHGAQRNIIGEFPGDETGEEAAGRLYDENVRRAYGKQGKVNFPVGSEGKAIRVGGQVPIERKPPVRASWSIQDNQSAESIGLGGRRRAGRPKGSKNSTKSKPLVTEKYFDKCKAVYHSENGYEIESLRDDG